MIESNSSSLVGHFENDMSGQSSEFCVHWSTSMEAIVLAFPVWRLHYTGGLKVHAKKCGNPPNGVKKWHYLTLSLEYKRVIVQALPPWVYEPNISLSFSLLVVTRPHTDTHPMRWLFLKWIHHLMAWSCPGMALTKIGPNLGSLSTHTQPGSGTRLSRTKMKLKMLPEHVDNNMIVQTGQSSN